METKNWWKRKDRVFPLWVFAVGTVIIYLILRAQGAGHETSLLIMFLSLIYG